MRRLLFNGVAGTLTLFSVLLLSTCSRKPAEPRFSDSRFLSAQQNTLLRELEKRSPERFSAAVWSRSGTVSRLEMDTPSELGRNAPAGEHALAFVKKYAELWKLAPDAKLQINESLQLPGCTNVTLQLVHPSGAPVFNAVLGVGVTPEGRIRGAAGRMTGEPTSVKNAPRQMGARQAKQILLRHLGERSLVLPEPTKAVYDPYFMGDRKHAAAQAWVFSAPADAADPSGPFVVNAQTGTVTVSGYTPVAPKPNDPTVCPVDPSRSLPEVVVDPMTQTPAHVSLAGVKGIVVQGSTPADRAYSILESEMIARMYGVLNPRAHLQNPVVRPWMNGGTQVRFIETVDTIPVEGAQLSVVLQANGNAEAIFGRFVYYPRVPTTPTVSAATAVAQAAAKYGQLECRVEGGDCPSRRRRTPPATPATPPKLVILSSQIFKRTTIPAGQSRLAWRIQFPNRILYWNAARPGGYLFDYPTVYSHIPFQVRDISRTRLLEFNNSTTPVSGVTPSTDGAAVPPLLPTVNAFYSPLGRAHSFDNNDATMLCVNVNLTGGRTFFRPSDGTPGGCPGDSSGLFFSTGFVQGDVLAHEFTHAVSFVTANLANSDEPGALGESYSDLMGELTFPDTPPTVWLVGEAAPAGPIRDMAAPRTKGHPDHVALMRDICADLTCVHEWAGVTNRAAVFMSDGGVTGSPFPGIGRAKLALLSYITLTGGDPPATPAAMGLSASDRFLNARLLTEANCWSVFTSGSPAGQPTLTAPDCYHVSDSYDAVGITVAPAYGWTRFKQDLGGTKYDVTDYAGLLLFRGCTISDQILRAEDFNGTVMTSNIAAGLAVNMGGWGASVTTRAAATNPVDRTITYHVWADWFNTGTVRIDELYAMPAGVTTRAECLTPAPAGPPTPPPHLRTLFSVAAPSHFASFLDGFKSSPDPTVNGGVVMPAGCTVNSISAVHYHGGVAQVAAVSTSDGGHGYTVTPAGATPGALATTVHIWHDGLSGIAVRVLYNITEPAGVDCSVAGSTQNTP